MSKRSQEIKPAFSATMTQYVWTEIGTNAASKTAKYVATVHRPGAPLEIWVPMDLPQTSMKMQ